MSIYGKCWKIDGLVAGPVLRDPFRNGQYTVTFEREHASLEQIEAVNWACPAVEELPGNRGAAGLPEGYGFELTNVKYHHDTKSFDVYVKTAAQYLGDVTGYQAQIDALNAENEARMAAAAELELQLAEADEMAIALYEALHAGDGEGEDV